MNHISNTRVADIKPLTHPDELMQRLPSNERINNRIEASRKQLADIMAGRDQRLIAIVGPCSIHDTKAAIDYGHQLKKIADQLQDKLCIVMRIYFEKPRTTIGWKGLINDPYLDESFAINEGLMMARKLLLDINEIGLAIATEFLDTITPQYISDLISWAAIGARTTESQPHRMLASGLSMPVGFKNNTAGDIKSAVNAVLAASYPHRFLGVTEKGEAAIVATNGNPDCHVILRGGSTATNYQKEHVEEVAELLGQHKLSQKVMIDCSHGNSNKDFRRQSVVIDNLCQQLQANDHHLLGFMLESHLVEGRQDLNKNQTLTYGQSITDGCVGFSETVRLLNKIADCV